MPRSVRIIDIIAGEEIAASVMSSDSASSFNSDSPLSSDDSEFSKPEAEPVCSDYPLPLPKKVKINFTLPLDIGKLDIHDSQIKEDGSYYLTDENASDGGGALAVVHNRDLRVCDDINEGTEFTLEFLPTDKGDVVLIIYISTKPKIYLAWDRVNYSVRGMTDTELMDHESDKYWRKVPFEDIGECPDGSGYFALQYWGDAFGSPTPKNYYFIIDNKKIFRVATIKEAAEHGRLGLIEL